MYRLHNGKNSLKPIVNISLDLDLNNLIPLYEFELLESKYHLKIVVCCLNTSLLYRGNYYVENYRVLIYVTDTYKYILWEGWDIYTKIIINCILKITGYSYLLQINK